MATDRNKILAERAGSAALSDTQTANTMLRSSGQPGQFGGGGYQVLGGPGTSQRLAINKAFGVGIPQNASQYVAQQGGQPGMPLGPAGFSAGGVGGGTVGAGGRPPIPGYQPPGQSTQMTAQQNPYIKQLMEMSIGQFNTPIDRSAERSALRKEQSQQLNEARQTAGRGGGMGMWGAQQQGLMRGFDETRAAQEVGFGTRETDARRALLATMSGIGGVGVTDIASQLRAQQDAADMMERARQADMNYQLRREEVANQGYSSRLNALSQLAGLL